MKTKLFWTVVVVAFLAYLFHQEAKDKAELATFVNAKQRMQAEIKSLALRHNAVDDWESRLAGTDSYRLNPVLTMELEKLWLVDRPILFLGCIKDVSTVSDSIYALSIRRCALGVPMFSTRFELKLRAPKLLIDGLIANNPRMLKDGDLANKLAVVAKIDSLASKDTTTDNGDRKQTRVGNGVLLDLLDIDLVPRTKN